MEGVTVRDFNCTCASSEGLVSAKAVDNSATRQEQYVDSQFAEELEEKAFMETS
jgi:hypothetical protein